MLIFADYYLTIPLVNETKVTLHAWCSSNTAGITRRVDSVLDCLLVLVILDYLWNVQVYIFVEHFKFLLNFSELIVFLEGVPNKKAKSTFDNVFLRVMFESNFVEKQRSYLG